MNISLSGHFRGILFDVGWTLVYPDPTRDAAIQAVLREQGFYIPPAVWDEGYRAAEAFYLARRWQPETRQNLRAFWFGYYSELLASLSPAIRDGGLVALLMQEVEKAVRWNLYPDTLEVMSELRSRGFGLGAVSNWNQGLPALCQEWGLAPYLDALVVSDVAGFHKPDRRIFELVLRALRVSASRTLHVGDDYVADVEGARAVGITPVLIDRDGRYEEIQCLRVDSLLTLLSFVGWPCRSS